MAAIEKSVRATAAIDDLYRRHVGDVYRYTYAVLGNHADAEDVTQTTFVNALRALERGEEPRNAGNWLLVIAHNIVRQRWRQAAARPAEVELVHDVPDVSDEEDVELDGLVRALQRIPPSQREALVMRELEGRSYQEISELLGLTTSALETLLFRARRSLAEELENVVTCQSAELAMSRRLDERLSRKESRRLDEHLAECAACAKLSATQARQRRAFKGLALIPLPVGLELFKGAPSASAASLPTIGLAGTNGTTGVGAATAGGSATGAGTAGGVAAGGSLLGAGAVKVAAAVVAGVLVTGAAYTGARAVLDGPGSSVAAKRESRAVKGAFADQGQPRPNVSSSSVPPLTSSSASSGSETSLGGESAPAGLEPGTAGAPDTSGNAAGAASDPRVGTTEPTTPRTGNGPGGTPGDGPGGTPGNGPGGTPGDDPGGPPAGGPGEAPGDGSGGTAGGTAGGTTSTPSVTPPAVAAEPPTAADAGPKPTKPRAKKPKKAKKPKPTTPVTPQGSGDREPPGQAKQDDKPEPPGKAKQQFAPSTGDASSAETSPQPVDGQPKHDKAGKTPDSAAAAAPSADAPAAAAPEPIAPAPVPSEPGSEQPGNANGHDKK